MLKEDTFNAIYDQLEDRLNVVGEINATEAWKLTSYNYGTVRTAFRMIIETMIEQKKAIKLTRQKYLITKPNLKK